MSKIKVKVGDYIEGYEILGFIESPIIHKIWLRVSKIDKFKNGHVQFEGQALDCWHGARGSIINTKLGKIKHVDAVLAESILHSSRYSKLPYDSESRVAERDTWDKLNNDLEFLEFSVKEVELDIDSLEYMQINYVKTEKELREEQIDYNKEHILPGYTLENSDGHRFKVLGISNSSLNNSKSKRRERIYLVYKRDNSLYTDELENIQIVESFSNVNHYKTIEFKIVDKEVE